jgi:hypothetical protein
MVREKLPPTACRYVAYPLDVSLTEPCFAIVVGDQRVRTTVGRRWWKVTDGVPDGTRPTFCRFGPLKSYAWRDPNEKRPPTALGHAKIYGVENGCVDVPPAGTGVLLDCLYKFAPTYAEYSWDILY